MRESREREGERERRRDRESEREGESEREEGVVAGLITCETVLGSN